VNAGNFRGTLENVKWLFNLLIGCILKGMGFKQKSTFFHVYIASSKHDGASENSRQLCKLKTQSRVYMSFGILPNP